MDGATAVERICPWRRSSVLDGAPSVPSNDVPTTPNTSDPALHPVLLTSANVNTAYNKSSEYVGDFATITKPEAHISQSQLQDVFNNQSRISYEKQDEESETASMKNITYL